MIDTLLELWQQFPLVLPLILLLPLNGRTNLKRSERNRQFLMPVASVLCCFISMLGIQDLHNLLQRFLNALPGWITRFGEWLLERQIAWLQQGGEALITAAQRLEQSINANLALYLFALSNVVILLVYLLYKRALLSAFRPLFARENALHRAAVSPFYEYDEKTGNWYLARHCLQARKLLKVFYYSGMVLVILLAMVCCRYYRRGELTAMLYPVYGVLLLGEPCFFIDGMTRRERHGDLEGEEDSAEASVNYSLLRLILRRLFGDKLNAEDTTVNNDPAVLRTNDELLTELEDSDEVMVEAYGTFMRRKAARGMDLDQDYLISGLDLLRGKSVLFNNPFYYDLVPYLFYPMNRVLLRHAKVLIVLGRHDTEQDIETWCRYGLTQITGVPPLWRIGVLNGEAQELEVGILTRSSVHDLALHEANEPFFDQVEFVVLIEPSKLMTTAQVGLNSIVRRCRKNGRNVVYCSTDKNCDGLLDALSHLLLTSLTEVSATSRHRGISSYMCWEADDERLQHRLLPGISRYLGVGTELSFAALKNQVSRTEWYGGDAFPVVDIHWIVKQYYYPLLHYAQLPATQETVDHYFRTAANLWDARVEDRHYLTVEDEAFNMFEARRDFASRARSQGFVNVITTDYLLRDYMAANDQLFDNDPKAISYIVADYDRTLRNVTMRLCLRMSAGSVPQTELRKELLLIDEPTQDVRRTLWHNICLCFGATVPPPADPDGEELLVTPDGARFTQSTLQVRKRFSMDRGEMETCCFITDPRFIEKVIADLCSADYVAEDEHGQQHYLGTELRGHIFQRHLPGQFFTLGGKYYEMLRVNADGQVLVRRSADHIGGRPSYRQERRYTLSNLRDSQVMGERIGTAGMQISVQYADIRVQTPAYWNLKRYNDFASGRHVTVNGIPERQYQGKRVLRLDFSGTDATPEILHTLVLLLNESFRTLFAENQPYIVVLLPGEAQVPCTYSLFGEGVELGERCLYLVEDSQLDIGLLTAAERNLDRIFSVVCDYLDWHLESLECSLNPPPAPVPPAPPSPNDGAPEGKKGPAAGIGAFFHRIKASLLGLFRRIKDFLTGLFRRKPKQTPEPPEPAAEAPSPTEAEPKPPTGDTSVEETVPGEDIPGSATAEPPATEGASETDGEPTAATPEELPEADGEEIATPAEDKPEPAAAEAEAEVPAGEALEPDGEEAVSPAETESAHTQDGEETDHTAEEPTPSGEGPVSAEAAPASAGESDPAAQPKPVESDGNAEDNGSASDVIALMSTGGGHCSAAVPEDGSIEFEPAETVEGTPDGRPERRPYHARYYLLYGGSSLPEGLDIAGTLAFLQKLGYGDSDLKQARTGKTLAQLIEAGFHPDRSGAHYCDFCGVELVGTEREVLKDGRERCMQCSRTAVRTEEEFASLYRDVRGNLEAFFEARINVPVHVRMVNAKRLHKSLNKSFVPTGQMDGRVLGVAIKEKDEYTILVENGAPRVRSMLTMAHELTHIWQYENWDRKQIRSRYGAAHELEIYEGMAKWAEIQYAYLINEPAIAKREEILTRRREDEYGSGFRLYAGNYPLSERTSLNGSTPFNDPQKPL